MQNKNEPLKWTIKFCILLMFSSCFVAVRFNSPIASLNFEFSPSNAPTLASISPTSEPLSPFSPFCPLAPIFPLLTGFWGCGGFWDGWGPLQIENWWQLSADISIKNIEISRIIFMFVGCPQNVFVLGIELSSCLYALFKCLLARDGEIVCQEC